MPVDPFNQPQGASVGDPADQEEYLDEVFTVDFTGATSGGSRYTWTEGIFKLRVIDVKSETARSSGNPMYTWELAGADPSCEGKLTTAYTALTPTALWKLEEMLKAINLWNPQGHPVHSFSRREALGREFVGVFRDEVYEGVTSGKLDTFANLRDYQDLFPPEEVLPTVPTVPVREHVRAAPTPRPAPNGVRPAPAANIAAQAARVAPVARPVAPPAGRPRPAVRR